MDATANTLSFSFCKEERLCSRKLIESLFAKGHRFMLFPFSVSWMLVEQDDKASCFPAQVLITTSKRKFHHAVDRNRVKRLIRESHRHQKHNLYSFLKENNLQLVFSVGYIHTEIFQQSTVDKKYSKMLETLKQQIEASIAPSSL